MCPGRPLRVAVSAGCAGSARVHSQTVPSLAPAARVLPSGVTATVQVCPDGPVNGAPSRRGRAGLATSHRYTSLSELPIASVRLSGVNASPIG